MDSSQQSLVHADTFCLVLCRVTAVSRISQGFWAMLFTKTVECPYAATIKYLKTPLYVQCSKHQTSKKSAAPSSPRTLVTEIWNSSVCWCVTLATAWHSLSLLATQTAQLAKSLYFLLQRPVLRPHTDAFVCHTLCDLDCCVAAYIPGNLDLWKHKTIQCNKIEFQQAKAESDKAVRTKDLDIPAEESSQLPVADWCPILQQCGLLPNVTLFMSSHKFVKSLGSFCHG